MSVRYREDRCIGSGRAGSVYEAFDHETGRVVALRRFDSKTVRRAEQRWRSEFHNLTGDLRRLEHGNILRILDSGVDDKGPFLVSERVEGRKLSLLMEGEGKGMSLRGVHDLASQMLDAYEAASSYGFYHFSLRPSSVMGRVLDEGGYHFTLMDLGHSRLLPLMHAGEMSSLSTFLNSALMAPEVYEGRPDGIRSSLYMLGQLLYWVCAGGHPLAGLTLELASAKHKAGEIPYLRGYRADLPECFRKWIYYLIQPDVDLRLRSVREARLLLPDFGDFVEEERVMVPRKMEFGG